MRTILYPLCVIYDQTGSFHKEMNDLFNNMQIHSDSHVTYIQGTKAFLFVVGRLEAF